jgi:nicotinamidase-related amidase
MTVALVLLDLQKGILLSDRIKFEDPQAPRKVLAVAESLRTAARAAGVPVIQVGVVRPRARGAYDALRTANAVKTGKASRDILALAAGSDDVAFALEPHADEEIVHKVGVSAFQGTRLDALLRNAGVEHVVVGGAFTHMVVESTVRQGFDLGYRMTVVEDACCAPAAGPHNAALAGGIPNFAVVVSSAEAIALFQRGARAG